MKNKGVFLKNLNSYSLGATQTAQNHQNLPSFSTIQWKIMKKEAEKHSSSFPLIFSFDLWSLAGRLTSLRFGEAFVQVEDDLVHKVLDVGALRPADKHHPVVGEALHRGLLPHLRTVAQLQLHLDRTLPSKTRKRSWSRRQTEAISFFDLTSLPPHRHGPQSNLALKTSAPPWDETVGFNSRNLLLQVN